MPLLHDVGLWHVLPQEPQLLSSYKGSMQVPPQSTAKLGHWHEPVLQDFPPVHVVPHVPQLELLVCRLTHAPLQFVVPAAQLAVHTPLLHTSMPTH